MLTHTRRLIEQEEREARSDCQWSGAVGCGFYLQGGLPLAILNEPEARPVRIVIDHFGAVFYFDSA